MLGFLVFMCVILCDFADYCFICWQECFAFFDKIKTKGLLKTVCWWLPNERKILRALFYAFTCVWGWVFGESLVNENNYDSMRICCLSNRRVKNVFCVIFVNLTFDSFWFTLFFQRQKIGSVCGCVLVLHQQFYFNIFYSFHYFSSLYSQDLIYQSSLVRGNRKKTVQELFAFSCRPLYKFCLFCLAEV